VRYQAQGRSLNRDLGRCLKGAAPGARGDGYRVGAYRTYSEPIRRSFFNQRGDEVSPIDNYFFNVSTTMGERVTCSLLRGAGEVFGRGGSARGAHEPCATFPNDDLQPAGADVGGD